MYEYDVYLCVENLKNRMGFTCVKYPSFPQADAMYDWLTISRGVPKSNRDTMLAIPKIIPNYFVKPILEYALQSEIGRMDDYWSGV
jgi:hypothetical protein